MPAPTSNPDADHVLTLHERIRNALFTGTADLDLVRKTLDEADNHIRGKFSKSTGPATRPPSLDAQAKKAAESNPAPPPRNLTTPEAETARREAPPPHD